MAHLPERPRLGFFVSHRGSNMRAIFDACQDRRVRAEPALLISNNKSSAALAWAEEVCLSHINLCPTGAGSEEALDEAHLKALQNADIDLIILAKRVISTDYFLKFATSLIRNVPMVGLMIFKVEGVINGIFLTSTTNFIV